MQLFAEGMTMPDQDQRTKRYYIFQTHFSLVLVRRFYGRNHNVTFCRRTCNAILCRSCDHDRPRPKDHRILYLQADISLVLWCWSEGSIEGITMQLSVEGIAMQLSVEGITM